MTKYIKTGATEFEQFDGSDEIIEKYDIRKDTEYLISDDPLEYQIAPYQIESLEGWLNLNVGDWIATGVEGEHWPVDDDIFYKEYEKLPVIPKAWGDTIEEFKANRYRLDEMFTEWDWNYDEQKLIARAWLDGYEVADD